MRNSTARIAAAAALSALMVIGVCTTASAHIQPDPIAAQEGTTVTVHFDVEHGCAGSPTTGSDIKMPDGITDAKAVAKPGWTATVDSSVVRFVGQSPSGDRPDTFAITFTAPSAPGEVHFPVVQKCAKGSTDWLDVAQPGQPEPANPAPSMNITAGPPSSAELTPAPDADADGPTSASGPAVTAVVTSSTTTPASNDTSTTGVVVGIVLAAIVVFGGAVLGVNVARRNRRSTR